jgi:hypothetical protein
VKLAAKPICHNSQTPQLAPAVRKQEDSAEEEAAVDRVGDVFLVRDDGLAHGRPPKRGR